MTLISSSWWLTLGMSALRSDPATEAVQKLHALDNQTISTCDAHRTATHVLIKKMNPRGFCYLCPGFAMVPQGQEVSDGNLCN